MTQEEYTTKRRKFQHLTKEKRAQIEILLRQKLPKVQIARAVGISRSTLYSELKRGTVEQIDTNLKGYRACFWDAGQRVYEENRKNCRPPLKEEKPEEINSRTTFGHWEIDTIVGKQGSSAVLLSLDERTKLHRHFVKIPSRSREGVGLGLKKIAEYLRRQL